MSSNLKALFGTVHGLDQKSIEFLTKALEKNNLPGFDYIEFKQSLGALAKLNMDEKTAFMSAFATASTMGLTKAKLVETGDHYKKVLMKEKEQFDKALQKQLHQRVESKRTEIEKLKGQIVKYKEKVKELEAQIAKHQNTIDNADAIITGAREKIEATKDSFEHTFQSLYNQIEKDIENIDNYL